MTARPRSFTSLPSPLRLLVALIVAIAGIASGATLVGAETGVAAINSESAPAVAVAADIGPGHVGSEQLMFDDGMSGCCVAPRGTPSGNPHGLGVTDPPSRVAGPWTDADLARGAMGRPPRSLGSPELHHADQMPGAGIHEIDPVTHRLPGNHPNRWNQGVTDEIRRSDRELHWWYRSQEMGGRDVLGEEYFYD